MPSSPRKLPTNSLLLHPAGGFLRQEECLCFKQSYLLGSDTLFSLQTSNFQPCLAKLLLCQTTHSTGTSNSLGQDQQQASVPEFISWCWDIKGSWWDESPRDYRCAPLLQGTVRNEILQVLVKRTEDRHKLCCPR